MKDWLLNKHPLEIQEAVSGHEAITKSIAEEYDLVFMDIQMPEMNGVEALQEMRRLGVQTPVVACTANVMKEDVDTYLEKGFAEVIGKPYLAEDLLDCVARFAEPEYKGGQRTH